MRGNFRSGARQLRGHRELHASGAGPAIGFAGHYRRRDEFSAIDFSDGQFGVTVSAVGRAFRFDYRERRGWPASAVCFAAFSGRRLYWTGHTFLHGSAGGRNVRVEFGDDHRLKRKRSTFSGVSDDQWEWILAAEAVREARIVARAAGGPNLRVIVGLVIHEKVGGLERNRNPFRVLRGVSGFAGASFWLWRSEQSGAGVHGAENRDAARNEYDHGHGQLWEPDATDDSAYVNGALKLKLGKLER